MNPGVSRRIVLAGLLVLAASLSGCGRGASAEKEAAAPPEVAELAAASQTTKPAAAPTAAPTPIPLEGRQRSAAVGTSQGPAVADFSAEDDGGTTVTLREGDDAPPESAAPLSAEAREAFQLLATTAVFATTAQFGFGMQTPEEIKAFQRLLREPASAARQAFLELADGPSAAGKLYGLCGLAFTDRAAFTERVAALSESEERVLRLNGGIQRETTVGKLVRNPDRPDVPPMGSGLSLADYDIAHGDWPMFLRNTGVPRSTPSAGQRP